MEISNLITKLTNAYETQHDFIKDYIDKGQLKSSPDNKEPGLAELIMAGKLRSEWVEEIIDFYHIEAINNLLDNAQKNDSDTRNKTIYINKAGTISDCSKSIILNEIDELIIIGKINQKDLSWIFEMSNYKYRIKTLDLTNTIIESCEICFDPDGHDESVTFRKNTIQLGGTTYPKIKKYILPKFITNIETNQIEFWSFSDIDISNENIFYSSNEGVLYNKKQTKIIRFPANKPDISFSIPNTVISIGEDSFSDCKNLTSIIIPNSVTTIENRAFCSCESLTDINISESVISIGRFAFANCNSLSTITIPNSVSKIGENCFYTCIKLSSINIQPCNNNFISENGILFDKQKLH